ncbi:hypothetical protein [Flavobacterium degerlachei]|jgi:hypothetical protein|uniref:Uncharacterized protein n=1 Tax=Flavobacterium degerlachei TaxID=229203 RepID=A0A1H2Z3Y1_9FLAO|nr:hypothetical protein [Flavobacterium degerlachei]SDX12173.1 hypothetical protein SAMN05444338_10777 [Flavobacterium degerlachei]
MKDRGIQLSDGNGGLEAIDLKIEVQRDGNGKIAKGLIIGNTLSQNQALLLIANPGEIKFVPTLGVAIVELTLDNDYLRFRHRIREHFSKDGLNVRAVELSQGKPLKIEASYE